MIGAIVVNCLLRYALAPVWMAPEISSILGFPFALLRTYLAKSKPTTIPTTAEIKIIVKNNDISVTIIKGPPPASLTHILR